ncbi:hypothetical protein EV702DRAFT_962403 [Suillus placidus]|uniref:Uncharacterized protein n=1 Tax=Suillus placidus TaxID=48579 RepID=A0A9P7A2X4_9AGAM|nr:hypothetical protein EV702DRAFT_962403 [Suillus placidus]
MAKLAVVEQSAPSKSPKLTAGELTSKAACDWDNACSTYFMHKDIEPKNQVKIIVFGMLDPRLQTWYLTQLSYPRCWNIPGKVLGSQQGTRGFYEWALDLQNQNTLLYGNPAHLSDIQLCNQLEVNICDKLTTPILRAKLAPDLTLKKWIEEVKHLDDKHLEDLTIHRKFAEDFYKSSKHVQNSHQT